MISAVGKDLSRGGLAICIIHAVGYQNNITGRSNIRSRLYRPFCACPGCPVATVIGTYSIHIPYSAMNKGPDRRYCPKPQNCCLYLNVFFHR
jgi:hypothetical protein